MSHLLRLRACAFMVSSERPCTNLTTSTVERAKISLELVSKFFEHFNLTVRRYLKGSYITDTNKEKRRRHFQYLLFQCLKRITWTKNINFSIFWQKRYFCHKYWNFYNYQCGSYNPSLNNVIRMIANMHIML